MCRRLPSNEHADVPSRCRNSDAFTRISEEISKRIRCKGALRIRQKSLAGRLGNSGQPDDLASVLRLNGDLGGAEAPSKCLKRTADARGNPPEHLGQFCTISP
jgi:hypothetical protein